MDYNSVQGWCEALSVYRHNLAPHLSLETRGLGSKKLKNEYNNCLEEIRAFRDLHLEFASIYIHKQSQIKNPFGGGSTITGTGGTPFMKYLKKHRDETEKQKI